MRETKPPLVLILAVSLCSPPLLAATQSTGRRDFPDSVRTIAAASSGAEHAVTVTRTVLSAAESSAVMTFEVALRMRSFGEMQARIARGELISDSEKAAKYFPLPADHEKLVQWLKAQGLEVTRTDDDRLGVFGRGSVDAVGRAFKVTFARVAVRGDREYTSAVTAPSLPSDVASVVLGIHGLQPHIKRRVLATPRALQPNVNLNGYLPQQIATAYNAAGLGVTGAGQTIAVYALAFPEQSDLTKFWAAAGVSQSASNIQSISVAGGPDSAPSDNSAEEAALDVEWTSALAPGAAIRVYAANENDPALNDEILQQVYADLPTQPNMHVLNICIGGSELDVPSDYLVIEAQYMANLASSGVTVLVASGDNGAVSEGVVQTTYPTSDPDVTGVGGTTLTLKPDNTVASEVAWPGSGGGKSIVFSRPAWQTGSGIGTGSTSGTMRLVPDVAALADPSTGALVVYNGNNLIIGGTSLATPVWSAFCALMNQKRGAPLGLLNPKIYPFLGTSGFRDITSGGNNTYSAGAGYDLLTGIGAPDVTALLSDAFSPGSPVNIPAQLGDRVVTVGQAATFFVVAEGALPLSYQWQLAIGSSAWANVADSATYSGSASSTLVVSGATHSMSGYQFRCVVSNASGTATSTPATLTVSAVGVTTLAGWPGAAGSADGTGSVARFAYPGGLRADGSGNIYVSDSGNYTIRKVTAAGVVTTVAGTAGTSGSTDGPAASALFAGVGGVAFDSAGNLYIADSGNYTIRKISAAGTVSTLAGVAGSRGETDGSGSQARFYDPQNLAVDAAGSIYVADGMGDVVRKVTPSGAVTTLAGKAKNAGSTDGAGSTAQFNDPTGIAVDPSGNVYVADYGNDTVRKITPDGAVTTLAGVPGIPGQADGTGAAARFSSPAGVGVDPSGNVYVADAGNDLIRVINPSGFVTTVAGLAGDADSVDGSSGNARFNTPGDVTIDPAGVVYIADAVNQTIRRVIPGVGSAPFFTAQPADQEVSLGASAAFSAGISGTAPFTYQWNLNGSPIPGATSPSYAIAGAQESDAGSYTLSVTDSEGTATSFAATLTVDLPAGYPDITAQPQGGTLPGSGTLVLSVSVTGNGPFAYQWMVNGSPIAGATAATYTASAPGGYTVSISNAVATTVSSAATVSPGGRLVNISSRSDVGTGGGIAIAGFVINGPPGQSKQLLIRGIGPALANFGVSGVLTAPTITLVGSNGATIASNTGWGTGSNPAQVAAATDQVGAFGLASGSADSAMLASVQPGPYTVKLSGVGNTTGVGLLEIYETVRTEPELLVNISTRAQVGTGGNVLIAGFVITGSQPAKVLVRGVGPALAAFGVTGALAQPVLTVSDASGGAVGANTGWGSNSNAADIAAAAAQVGAFGLASGSADSALLIELQPGAYTAQVAGAGGSTGIALAEVYELP